MTVSLVPESFDIVYAGAFIHLFHKKISIQILAQFYKLLRDHGILFINTTVHEVSAGEFLQKTDFDGEFKRFRRHWSEEELRGALEDANFHILRRLYREVRQKRWVGFICEKSA